MISIAEAISDLLYVRDTVVVPGLGSFVKKPVSATVNPVANYFGMPSSEITFDASLREDNDLVVNYMAEKNDIPEDEARRLLAMFVSDCYSNLKAGNKVPLHKIGVLSHDWADDIEFRQSRNANYNADAFGLSDFSLVSVSQEKSKATIKAEIEQKQREKNTPVTVDEKAVHEGERHTPRRGWLWLLLALLIIGGIGYGLQHFKMVDFTQWIDSQTQEQPTPWKVTFPKKVRVWNTETLAAPTVESESQTESPAGADQGPKTMEIIRKPNAKPDPVKQPDLVEQPAPVKQPQTLNTEANIRIIAGCFSQEENAERLANLLKNKGYKNAFYELRGSKWYVSFGRYATDEEATAKLREIRANTEYKAWILK